MARRSITLICETCGESFEARAHRRVELCQACAQGLRLKGMGPVQAKKRRDTFLPSNEVETKVMCWERAEADLIYYLERFARYPVYDGVIPLDLDLITDEDGRLANTIAARMSARTWSTIVGESIEQVGDWDLLRISNSEWEIHREVIRQVFCILLRHRGIGVARLTKALHRKRPKLIPVCDSVVLEALGVEPGNKADRIIACMDKLRLLGREQLMRLQELRALSRHLGAEMTELRILELLYWVQFGPFARLNREG